jgi:PAS domain S-box-containing protein
VNQESLFESAAGMDKHKKLALWLATIFVIGTFLADLLTPLGFAHGVLYIPALVVAMYAERVKAVLALGAFSVCLTLLGWALSPPAPEGFPAFVIGMNRLMAVGAIALTTLVGTWTIHLRKKLELAKWAAEKGSRMLSMASEVGHLGAWEFNSTTEDLTWSPEVCRLHGLPENYRPTVVEGISHYSQNDQPRIQKLFDACLQTGKPFDEEFQITTVQGISRWVRTTGRAVLNRDGIIVRVEGTFQDINHHKNVEFALAESLTSWRRLAETLPIIVWTADQLGRITYTSQSLSTYSGTEAEALKLEGWMNIIHPADQPTVAEVWPQSVATGKDYEVEFRIRRHDGAYRWHLARATRLRLQGDIEETWYGTAIDIDDRIRLENELRKAANRYEMVLESVTDAIFALDKNWNFTLLNHHAEILLQKDKSQLIGKCVWEEFPEAVNTTFQTEYERCAREAVTVRFEERFDPLGKFFEVTAYPSPDGISVHFRDVTDQRKFNEHLEQAQKLESIGQLTGGVAHDFNNLLTVILGNSELVLESQPVGSTNRRLLEVVLEAAERGASMTQRLLAFARKQALSPQPVDVNKLVANMNELLQRSLGEHIEIEVIRHAGLWKAMVDPIQLENALLNLAINARDAMPKGGRLTIETWNARLDANYVEKNPGLSEGAYVMLGVSDTGGGISPDIIERIFDPFFTTKPKGHGTGLGLAMVHGFVKQSNGHVTVYSELGQGTTFRIYLPRTEERTQKSQQLEESEIPYGEGELVLLVEDDELVRSYATSILSGINYRVVVAHDGPSALEKIQLHPDIALLFTDVVMPGGMTGRDLANAVKKIRPTLPILYTSGYTDNAIIHHGRLDPDVLLISKPYRRSELARRVRQALTA